MQLPADALAPPALVALTGYALATPFCVYPPLFKRMWNGRRHDLFAVQELGVVLIVVGWALRGDKAGAIGNGMYGVALAAAYALKAGRKA